MPSNGEDKKAKAAAKSDKPVKGILKKKDADQGDEKPKKSGKRVKQADEEVRDDDQPGGAPPPEAKSEVEDAEAPANEENAADADADNDAAAQSDAEEGNNGDEFVVMQADADASDKPADAAPEDEKQSDANGPDSARSAPEDQEDDVVARTDAADADDAAAADEAARAATEADQGMVPYDEADDAAAQQNTSTMNLLANVEQGQENEEEMMAADDDFKVHDAGIERGIPMRTDDDEEKKEAKEPEKKEDAAKADEEEYDSDMDEDERKAHAAQQKEMAAQMKETLKMLSADEGPSENIDPVENFKPYMSAKEKKERQIIERQRKDFQSHLAPLPAREAELLSILQSMGPVEDEAGKDKKAAERLQKGSAKLQEWVDKHKLNEQEIGVLTASLFRVIGNLREDPYYQPKPVVPRVKKVEVGDNGESYEAAKRRLDDLETQLRTAQNQFWTKLKAASAEAYERGRKDATEGPQDDDEIEMEVYKA